MGFFQLLVSFILGALLIYFYQSSTKKKNDKKTPPVNMPSAEEQERRLAEFKSTPFAVESTIGSNLDIPEYKGMYEVVKRDGSRITVKGGVFLQETECSDFGTFDYHSMSTRAEVVDLARKTVVAYGVGSCGPRSFYGTVKPHVECEKAIAKFAGTDDAAVYSFSFATIATLISCFAGRGDYLVCDRANCAPVHEGCVMSRANMLQYDHLDLKDLEAKLKEVVAKDGYKKPHRRFVVTEGVFKNFGDIVNLTEVLRLCKEYKFRLIMDDSYGFGAVGKTGRGTPELFNVPTKEVDVYVGSLSTSLGGVGGFCAGEANIIDFQRLSATAYVFSASLPPYVTAACTEALRLLQENPTECQQLLAHTKKVREAVRNAKFNRNKVQLVECEGDASPIIVVRATEEYLKAKNYLEIEGQIQTVLNKCAEKKVLLVKHNYSSNETTKDVPSLRVVVKSHMSEQELDQGVKVIVEAISEVFA